MTIMDLIAYQFTYEVKILDGINWPAFQEYNTQCLTPQIEEAQLLISEKYDPNRKKLSWMNSLTRVVLLDKYQDKEIHVSMYQAQILYLFQFSNEPKTFMVILNLQFTSSKEIMKETKLDQPFLKKNLAALVFFYLLNRSIQVQIDLLLQHEEGMQDSYRFNENIQTKDNIIDNVEHIFTDKPQQLCLLICYTYRFLDQVNQDFDQSIEAFIVKLMKDKRVLPYKDIVIAVQNQLVRFSPKVSQVKERMEKLINNQYIERDQQDRDIIHYKI